ncbi:MAG: CBS domain-containing protein [Gammaproteobacteria bacterium]|nr:CBS domain-containing protein [Gammaproteobacteria bacterium]MCE7896739.1 CBS domain-containing protein [Gammaproteobacteria bacterium PRO8]MCL4777148.1 CBS domain-containing protein [Gammaproteobacteria bacterium]MDL1880610.1 CBS domain-containing protein [Gammaproteobacteria bacterium PRO2]GIK35387.1 MAG: inosine-5-monophosphate dehydrogenase [Gammaproteobacteria bacterium]
MQTVADILGSKGRELWTVKPTDTVLEALRVMAEHDIGAVAVLDGEKLVGIFTERDYARKVVLIGRASRDSAVRDIMTHKVMCVAPDRPVNECMALMTEHRLRHLPVLHQKRVVGIVSIGDLVKATIEEQEFTITQLQSYVTG